METQSIANIRLDKYETGWVITIKDKNITIIKEYFTTCFISYRSRLFELHNDYILEHVNENINQYKGKEFSAILPLLLEHGNMLDRTKEPNKTYVKNNKRILR